MNNLNINFAGDQIRFSPLDFPRKLKALSLSPKLIGSFIIHQSKKRDNE
jgi:hypothetical protein